MGTLAGGWGYAAFGLRDMYLYWSFAILPLAVIIWICGWCVGSDVGRPSEQEGKNGGVPNSSGMSVNGNGELMKDTEALYSYQQLQGDARSGSG